MKSRLSIFKEDDPREDHLERVRTLLENFPVVAILGARQVGKTTLGEEISARSELPTHRFDLENPAAIARLQAPMLALEPFKGLIVLDEIQRLPEVFAILRVLADRKPRLSTFLVLGSASGDLLRQSSESLARRIAYHHLPGIRLREVDASRVDRFWLRGGFPRPCGPAFLSYGGGNPCRVRSALREDLRAPA